MEKTFRCHSCSEGFNSLKKFNVHLNLRHKEVDDRKKKTIKCNVCGYESRNGQGLIRHMRTHTGERPFKCEIGGCGMDFKQQATLNDHIKSRHSDNRPYKCDFPGCSHTTKTHGSLHYHKKVHSDERPFACPNSGCSFRAKTTSHIKIYFQGVYSETKKISCGNCDYKTALSGHSKRHMIRHSSKRDFRCSHPQCAKSFKCASDLKRHFCNRRGEKNIHCDHPGCEGKFARVKALWDHKSSVHAKKNHACPNPECNYRTNKPSALASHMVVHEGGNANIPCSMEGCKYKGKHRRVWKNYMRSHKTLLPCPVSGCGQYLATKEAIKDHLQFHNSSGRAFQCPLCLKHFRKLFQLQRHCVVHTNEKPFQCGQCEFAATTLTRVKAHIASLHAAVQFPFIVHLLDDRECLRCKVTLPRAEFVDHCKGHESPEI